MYYRPTEPRLGLVREVIIPKEMSNMDEDEKEMDLSDMVKDTAFVNSMKIGGILFAISIFYINIIEFEVNEPFPFYLWLTTCIFILMGSIFMIYGASKHIKCLFSKYIILGVLTGMGTILIGLPYEHFEDINMGIQYFIPSGLVMILTILYTVNQITKKK